MVTRRRHVPAALLSIVLAMAGVAATAERRAAGPTAVWIDTDPAAGIPERDVDDGLALVQAFNSPELAVRGVSIVFGNASLAEGVPVGRDIARRFGPGGLAVFEGAAGAADIDAPTPARRALAAALRREPLTILALGPLTNIAGVLRQEPSLASRITALVAVAGRRRGQRFTTGTTNPRGHRDFNFEQDPDAFRVLLDRQVPIALAPFELSSKVWLTERDMTRLADGRLAARWLALVSGPWLQMWREVFGVEGFNPFDTLAVAYVTHQQRFRCETLPIAIEVGPDDVTEGRMQGTSAPTKPYLVVAAELQSARQATYCFDVDASFKEQLLQRLGAAAAATPGTRR